MILLQHSANLFFKFFWVRGLETYASFVKKQMLVSFLSNVDSPLYVNGLKSNSRTLLSSMRSDRKLNLNASLDVQMPLKSGASGASGNLDNSGYKSALAKPSKLRDLFVRVLLHRFLLNLWGTEVTLCFFRNLQKTLSVEEVALIKLRQHRIFLLAPANLQTVKQRERYP